MANLFSEKLKYLRQSKNLTQDELAKKLFVSRSAVAKWEQNRGFPNIETLQQISELFDLSIDELLSDKQIELIQVLNTKKISLLKKVIIILVVILSVVIITAITLGIIYHPRNLSSYVKEDISTLTKIEVVNYDGKTFLFNDNVEKEIMNKVLDIKVIPKYLFVQKVVSSFDIMAYYEGNTYTINQYYIFDGNKNVYFEPVNFSMYELVCEYIGVSI